MRYLLPIIFQACLLQQVIWVGGCAKYEKNVSKTPLILQPSSVEVLFLVMPDKLEEFQGASRIKELKNQRYKSTCTATAEMAKELGAKEDLKGCDIRAVELSELAYTEAVEVIKFPIPPMQDAMDDKKLSALLSKHNAQVLSWMKSLPGSSDIVLYCTMGEAMNERCKITLYDRRTGKLWRYDEPIRVGKQTSSEHVTTFIRRLNNSNKKSGE